MRRHFLSLAIASTLALSAVYPLSVFAQGPSHATATPTQLPMTVAPSHYAIAIVPNADAATFTGQVSIDIKVLEPTRTITLNASALTIQSAQLVSIADHIGVTTTAAVSIKLNAAQQTATMEFPTLLAKGSYVLKIAYSGVIGAQANGLFHIDYDTAGGPQRALYTQFENSDARRFVPCWDEPNYKATFDLRVTVPAGQMAVSNMPGVTTALPDGKDQIQFATSPKMSTYLLFFGMGDFERATDMVDGTEVGVITQRGALSQAAFALASSSRILHEYNDYFGVRFPLPKLDNIAAPGGSQFFSAMENWGAIFTFENAMLLDPNISTQSDKERTFIVEAHEMAHQWFGDLVTMRWWDDLWLNEGFASWMENHSTQRLHPEWNTHLLLVNVHQAAMNLDSLATTHPVVQHIETVEQASQAFDEITYQKGESVIAMLEDYVGTDAWRDGVRLYMKQHAYSNTTSNDFWKSIEQASAKPITQIAHDFTLQPGVPMIKVANASCDKGTTTLRVTQGEFSRDQLDKKPLRWHVPVTAQVVGQVVGQYQPVQTLVNGSATLHLPGCGPVLLNAGQSGYFRTLYAPQQFNMLADHFAELVPIDQLGLLSDSWSLGLAGLEPMANVLNLAAAAPLTSAPQIWSNITGMYSAINQLYRNDAAGEQKFNQYAIARLTPVMARIGWNANPADTSAVINLREQLIDTLSQLDDTATIAEAQRRYAVRSTDPAAFPVDLRQVIMRVIAVHADQTTWDRLRATAQAEKSPMIKDQLYALMASAKSVALVNQAMTLAITNEPGATNSAGMLSHVARRYPERAFDFSIAHLDDVNRLVDSTSTSRYLPRLAEGSADPAMVGKLNDYAKAHISSSALGSTKTAVANINYHVKVRSQRLPEIDRWLAVHQ